MVFVGFKMQMAWSSNQGDPYHYGEIARRVSGSRLHEADADGPALAVIRVPSRWCTGSAAATRLRAPPVVVSRRNMPSRFFRSAVASTTPGQDSWPG